MQQGKHTVVIVGAGPKEEALIRQGIEGLADILAVEPDPGKAQAVLGEKSPHIALLYFDGRPDDILAVTKQVAMRNTCLPIIVSSNRNPDNILLAMRSGARDFAYVDKDGALDVRRAIADLGRLQQQIDSKTNSKVITVFSAKGGSGATTIASNLAGALLAHRGDSSQKSRKVALIDFDLEMGDVLVFLDLDLRYSFMDLLGNMHRLDSDLLYNTLTVHSSGLYVLTQSDRVEETRDISGEQLSEIIGFLRQHFDFVVIDGLRTFGEAALVGLDSADQILLTMTPDIPALKNANRCLRIFKRLGYPDDKISLVLNRYQKTRLITIDAISDALGKPIHGTVHNDFPLVVRAINKGELLVQTAPAARVSKDIQNLASLLMPQAPAKKRGLLSLWRSG